MYKAAKERPPIEAEVKIFTKSGDGTKRAAGTLQVKYKAVTTSMIDQMVDEDWLPSDVFDEVVIEAGPVGHPTETDERGEPVPMPAEEALDVIREDFNAVQHIIQQFWELNRVDPKSKTSRRRRKRG